MTGTVLLIEDDPAVREALAQTLELADMPVIATGSFVAAKDRITRDLDGVILSDIRMPGRDGFHVLTHALAQDPDLPVVLLTGEGDIPQAVRAMEAGAFDFLEKPCNPAALLDVLTRALTRRASIMADRSECARREAGDPAARLLFGISQKAEGLRAAARRAAATGSEVLVTGPPGSGIFKVAEVIHLCSPRAQGPFEKRAAEGLDRAVLAEVIARAEGGTLFLDDITRLTADMQMALTEALEAPRDWRLVAGSTVPVTDTNLQADLFYRLSVADVRVPALAERPEDIPVLYRLYVAQAAEQSGVEAPTLSPDHLSGLMAQSWPGNARALMNAAMRHVLGLEASEDDTGLGLAERLARVERSLLVEALERHEGRASEAARALKLARKTFYDKLARHDLRPEDFRR